MEATNDEDTNPAKEKADALRDVARYIRERADKCEETRTKDILNDHAEQFDRAAQSALQESEDAERFLRKKLLQNTGQSG